MEDIMNMIPADKVYSHIVGTVSEFRARHETAGRLQGQEVASRPVVLASVRECLGIPTSPTMRMVLGLS